MSIYKNGQKVLGSFNDVTGFVEKSDITTTINSSSTDTQVPSAKAIYNKSKNMLPQLPNGSDIIAYADSLGNEAVTETIRIMNGINSPYGVNNTSNDFYYTIYNMNDSKFKRVVAYDIRKNDMYMIMKYAGTWTKWRKLCTTSVADVPYTKITTYDDKTNIIAGTGYIEYCIKNGICYVNISGIQVSTSYIPNTTIILSSELPPSKVIQRNNSIDGSYTYNGGVVISDKLMAVMTTGGTYIHSSLSYPVAEN